MDYEGFKLQVYGLIGLDLSMYKQNQMKRRIDALINKQGCANYQEYLNILKVDESVREYFKTYLTINVTEFYRHIAQWKILENEILPQLISKNKTLRIWSAACSTGEEAYSLAMLLGSVVSFKNIEILATDIDINVLNRAKEGMYSAKSLENVPRGYVDKYFIKKNDEYTVIDSVKSCIRFKLHNLLRDPYPTNIDFIVCRNVLIYFTEEAKKNIYHKFNEALCKDGILFVGSTEQIIMSQDYGFESNKIFFYNKVN